MQIQTSKFATVSFALEEVLLFPDGLLDCADHRRWLLLPDACHADLFWLQSLSRSELAIPLASPLLVGIASLARIPSRLLAELGDDFSITPVVLMQLMRSPGGLWLDQQRPILINPYRRIGWQIAVSGTSAPGLAHSAQPSPSKKAA